MQRPRKSEFSGQIVERRALYRRKALEICKGGGSPQVFCLVTPMFKRSPNARERNTKMHRRSNSESLHEVNTVHALVIRMKILVRHGALGRLFRRASP